MPSTPARENRVGGLNSRTRNQARACSTWPRCVAFTARAKAVRKTLVQAVALAAVKPRSSPAAAARRACASAATAAGGAAARGQADLADGFGTVAEHESRLPVGERKPQPVGGGRRRRRRCRSRPGQGSGRKRCERCRQSPHGYWTIFTFSLAAACVT